MHEPLRFAIIGCGVIGPTHADALKTLPEARLVAVADVVAERAEQLAGRHGVAAYSDAQQMLERERPDVACICTPSGQHGDHAILAMRAGCHVVVEKPMEIRLDAIDEMLRVQREAGVKLTVISQHRFDPATQQVHAALQEGAFGKLVLGNALVPWWRTQEYYDSGAWRGTWTLDGGGVLMNQSIHAIDVLQWLMGPVRSLYAYTDTLAHRMETEDAGAAVLRFANGALGTIAATTGAYPGTGVRIEIYGDAGTAVIESDRLALLKVARDATEPVGPYGAGGASTPMAQPRDEGSASTASDPAALSANTHAAQIADLIRAIREDGAPLIDGHAARKPVEIILGIYESARSGREVRFA